MSRRLWGGGNTSPLKTTAWEANKLSDKIVLLDIAFVLVISANHKITFDSFIFAF